MGPMAYNNGAGMTRVITAAQFIKYNMPYGINYKTPQLTDERKDVAGYINQQSRPQKKILPQTFPTVKKTRFHPYPISDFSPNPACNSGFSAMEYYAKVHQITKRNSFFGVNKIQV